MRAVLASVQNYLLAAKVLHQYTNLARAALTDRSVLDSVSWVSLILTTGKYSNFRWVAGIRATDFCSYIWEKFSDASLADRSGVPVV